MKDFLTPPVIIEATYLIITPMFIGDANQNATEITPQSFKGALRFWWRALAWERIRQKSDNDEEALRELHKEEAKLFGSSAEIPKKDKEQETKIYGTGCFTIKLLKFDNDNLRKINHWPPNSANDSSSYLAYGITASGKGDKHQPHREGLCEGIIFKVELLFQHEIDKSTIIEVLEFIGLFGGLGSRSRRALGSIQLINIDGEKEKYKIKDAKDYTKKVNDILSNLKSTLPPYTALCEQSEFAASKDVFDSAHEAHKKLGDEYKKHRGQPSKLRGSQKKVFGLPLKGVDEQARRASPLFFHVFETSSGQFGYSVLYLPSSIFHKDQKHEKVNYQLIEGFVRQIGATT